MFFLSHSYFSLRYGTLSLEKLVRLAIQYKMPALVLTDINNSTGMVDFVKICNREGIHPIAGIEFRTNNKLIYTGIAKNNSGFKELNEFLSHHNLSGTPLPNRPPQLDNCLFIYPFEKLLPHELRENEYTGIRPTQAGKLFSSPYRNAQHKVVICQPLTYASISERELHYNLRAISNNILISKLGPDHGVANDEFIVEMNRLLKVFEAYPQIIRNSEKLLEACTINFDFTTVKNKKAFTTSPYDDRLLLEKLALDGFEYRYGAHNKTALQRLQKELEIIDRLGFSSYFLITWDIVRYSMSRGYYHVGRGSGANSITAYCLKITNVDPIELDLYFERFINPKRTSPPDFDIDYSWKERDEVQDYIFRRYGREHTALLGAMSTFKGRSILRELSKVYGLPKSETDALVKAPDDPANHNSITKKILKMGHLMNGFPNLRSIHAGGILVSEAPITCYTALDLPPKGFPTTQWDMYVAEDLGYEKLDILSQRGIGHIKEAAEIIESNLGIHVDVHNVQKFKTDPQVKKQLKRGETIGCFYVESPAMRGLLNKLRCDNYISLVAASSIIRPGVASSGMMREYIYRFHNPDKIKYLHPIMEQQLKETFGVMVYQEDVLKICHHFAGLDLSDADVLRRAMSGKYRSRTEFQKIVDKFFAHCKQAGYPDSITKEVWRQIESFAGYSFSKAHSASYAVESFQSLYLKAHYPKEFMVAVINNFGGYYPTWLYVNEAKRCGAHIELPCVNRSRHLTSIHGNNIFLGFIHLSNLEHKLAKRIVLEQETGGPFAHLEDFIERVKPGLEQLIILIRVHAFRFTGKDKASLLWEAHLLYNAHKKRGDAPSLFHSPAKRFELPRLEQSQLEDAYDEIEYLGFPVSLSFFDMLQTHFRGTAFSHNLKQLIGKTVRVVGQLVTVKYIKTKRKEMMNFGDFIDVSGNFIDTVHFPQSLRAWPFRGPGVYLIQGRVVEEFGFPSIEVEKMAKLPLQANPRA